jgi:hypothetical protein
MAQSTSPVAGSSPAREAIRGTVPKLAEIADTLITARFGKARICRSATAASSSAAR